MIDTGRTLAADELEFLAEDELVEILPNTTLGILHFIADDYGPIRTNTLCKVPLWLARQLRRSQLCRIIPPSWLHLSSLQSLLEAETNNRDDFQSLPPHYLEIATILLEVAREDIPRCEEVRWTIQSLREIRGLKIQQGLPLIDGNPMKLNNVGCFELNEIRPFLLGTLDQFTRLARLETEESRLGSTRKTNNSLYYGNTPLYSDQLYK